MKISYRLSRLVTASVAQDVAIGTSETVLVERDVYVEGSTLMVAVFNAVYCNSSALGRADLILKILAGTEVIGGTIAYVPNTSIDEHITVTGIKHFTDSATVTVRVTARDPGGLNMPVKAGSTLSILLIPL